MSKHSAEDAPPAYGSPTPSYGSPAPEAVTPNTRSVNQVDSKGDTAHGSTTTSAISGAAASITNVVPTSTEELKAQLAQAKAQIVSLTSQKDDSGLRQRKTDAVNGKGTTASSGMGVQQQQSADGVPVQIVAALCLLSFLLAYFFF